MNSKINLNLTPAERNDRRDQKRALILNFLRQHLWTSQDILQSVMNLESRQAAHKSLLQFESEQIIKRHVFFALGGKITIWGITAHGQVLSCNVGSATLIKSYFEPSRVSEQNIRHQLDLHKLRIIAERNGWTEWQDGDRIETTLKDSKRPDAIVISPSKHIVALECERTFKTFKRYEQILLSYLKLIKSGEISKVIWVSPTDDFKTRLEVLIKSIKALNVAGQSIEIIPDKHHKNLHFCSYTDWPNIHELLE